MLYEMPQQSSHLSRRDALRGVDVDTFDELVLGGPGSVVVEFMSYGCGHCRALEPFLQQAAEKLRGKTTFLRVNIGVEQDLAARFQIEGTPTLIMFLNGNEVGRSSGPTPNLENILEIVGQPFHT